MRPKSVLRLILASAAAMLLAAGCREATGITTSELTAHRERWISFRPVIYEYDYRLSGFSTAFGGHRIHLAVYDGVVRSAMDLDMQQSLSVSPGQWPSIDDLYDETLEASRDGRLRAVRFDPAVDYPTQIDFSGPPDASGSVFASNLQPGAVADRR